MKHCLYLLPLALLLCHSATAQDITGRWAGTAATTDEAGTKRQENHIFEIKNQDGKLTGLLVNRNGNGGREVQIQQDGAKFNFVVFLTLDGGEYLHWKFELKDDTLVGNYIVTHDNPKKWIYDRTGAITAARAKAAVAAPAPK